jgi:hypothetical protein
MELFSIKNFISKEDAKLIIDFIEQNDHQNNDSIKRRLIRFGIDNFNGTTGKVDELGQIGQLVKKHAFGAIDLIKDKHNDCSEIFLSTLWLSKQIPGSNVLAHRDTDGGMSMHYKYSGIIYLNTQEVGGEISFPKLGIEYKPEACDFVFFNCRDKKSVHKVKETTQNRYAIPMWFTDDINFRMY